MQRLLVLMIVLSCSTTYSQDIYCLSKSKELALAEGQSVRALSMLSVAVALPSRNAILLTETGMKVLTDEQLQELESARARFGSRSPAAFSSRKEFSEAAKKSREELADWIDESLGAEELAALDKIRLRIGMQQHGVYVFANELALEILGIAAVEERKRIAAEIRRRRKVQLELRAKELASFYNKAIDEILLPSQIDFLSAELDVLFDDQ